MSHHTTNLCELSEADRFTYLAHWRRESGDFALAAAWLQRAVALKQLAPQFDPLEIADDFFNLGLLYLELNDEFNARRFLHKACQNRARHLGARHPCTLEAIARLEKLANRHERGAEPLTEQSVLPESVPSLIPERRRIRSAG